MSKKEHVSGPLRNVEKTVEDPNVLNSIEGRLNNLKDLVADVDDPAEPEDVVDEPNPNENVDDSADEPNDASEPNPDDETDEEDGSNGKDGQPEPDKVEIPEAYIRCAISQGWTSEDIEGEYKANPERCLRTLGNIYNSTNKVSREFAALGRARLQAEQQQQQQPDTGSEIKGPMTEEAIAKLADGDEVIEQAFKTMNKLALDQAKTIAEFAKQPVNRVDPVGNNVAVNTALDNATKMQIDTFFNADDMKPYNEFYGIIGKGQDADDLTRRQRQNRYAVLQEADAIIAGKEIQGIRISTKEALESAHLLVTEHLREKIVVNKIKSSLTKRSKSKTIRPSQSNRPAKREPVKAKTRDQAIANATQRLSKLFG